MKNVLVIGAGRSSSSLIRYLLNQSVTDNFKVIVADMSEELAKHKVAGHSNGEAIAFDVFNKNEREGLIQRADVVISMLPARFHHHVAEDCIRFKKHMVTASYVSKEIEALDEKAKEVGVLLLNEIGLDPGIDHMSAMQVIDGIHAKGGEISTFKSFTGGLVAPESDNNPWNYKFTWNPRNVVLAGQGVAQFIRNDLYKYIPYHKLFDRTEPVNVLEYGEFEGYPNRDSLSYREVYGLENIPTIFRGTLRRPGFCKAWNVFVQLGITDDTYEIEGSQKMTYREFINSFLKYNLTRSVEEKLAEYVGISEDSDIMSKLKWLGIFDDKKIGLKSATPAQILQQLLEEKWTLESTDKDMIVMQHQFVYELDGKSHELHSSMGIIGHDQTYTAMAETVGLPVGIATKLILSGDITTTGVKRPVEKNIYEPVLKELEENGIQFTEEQIS